MIPIRRPNRAPIPVQKDGPRVNEEIRNLEIQLIDQTGTNLGTLKTQAAIQMAADAGFDLVEISPNTNPPVCKFLDYGKFKYS
ncbi:translation initiation factor IF-3, partial [Escherichia coli]|uniref:translation initiation factor IF-3 n=1 Tax=Escherichia coli TaxID=562 RepID=UPI0013D19F0D